MRFSPKNMCSVRHRPIPSAPKSRAIRESWGVSALVLITRSQFRSAHFISVLNSGVNTGGLFSTSPSITSPVAPSMLIRSSPVIFRPLTLMSLRFSSIMSSPAPATQHFPQPRATTAAWLVEPPVDVRIPAAACIPWISSGLVSRRTRMTLSPSSERATAPSAIKTGYPDAAPGEAGRPMVTTCRFAAGLNEGSNTWFKSSAGTRRRATFWVMRRSLTISTAILIAAAPVRFPVRVWSI